jgi:hypothetical protein
VNHQGDRMKGLQRVCRRAYGDQEAQGLASDAGDELPTRALDPSPMGVWHWVRDGPKPSCLL